ncbi:hypothetical protein L0Y69_00485 [bacterium]|nr:hypothetical protein [bacterium]
MTHYICTGGCMGESSNPGTCQASSCPKYGQDLEVCECEDGLHPAQLEAKKEAERAGDGMM